MISVSLTTDHKLIAALVLLCKINKYTDPFAYTQYRAQLLSLQRNLLDNINETI